MNGSTLETERETPVPEVNLTVMCIVKVHSERIDPPKSSFSLRLRGLF